MKSKKGTGIFDYLIEKAVNGLFFRSPRAVRPKCSFTPARLGRLDVIVFSLPLFIRQQIVSPH